MAKFLKKIGNRGFSLSELLITAGLLGFISVGVIQVIQDSNKVFTNSFTKLSTYFDQQIFFKELTKHIENSYVVKGGVFKCNGARTLSSKVPSIISPNNPLTKEYTLKNQGDSLSFPFVATKTIGTFEDNSVMGFLNANSSLNQLLLQKELFENMPEGSITEGELDDLNELIGQQEKLIEEFEIKEDKGSGGFVINVLHGERLQENDIVLLSTLASSKLAGLYRVVEVGKENMKVRLEVESLPSSFEDVCEFDNDEKTITDLITSAASMGASASTTFSVSKLIFVQYEVVSSAGNSSGKPDFLISYHSLDGKQEKARIKNLKEFVVKTKWTTKSSEDALLLAGDFHADISLDRLMKTHTGLIDDLSEGVALYSLRPSTRANYDIATFPRSSSPIKPTATVNFSPLFPGYVCSNLTDENCYGAGEDAVGVADQFFVVSAFLNDSFMDVSFSIKSNGEGLECWDGLTDSGDMVPPDKNTNTRGVWVFKKKAARKGTIALSRNVGSEVGRSYMATCHFKRKKDSDDYKGGYKHKSPVPKVEVYMSYHDINSGSTANTLVSKKSIGVYANDSPTTVEFGNGDPCTGSPKTFVDGKTGPALRIAACMRGSDWVVGSESCQDGEKVRFRPKVSDGKDLFQLQLKCQIPGDKKSYKLEYPKHAEE